MGGIHTFVFTCINYDLMNAQFGGVFAPCFFINLGTFVGGLYAFAIFMSFSIIHTMEHLEVEFDFYVNFCSLGRCLAAMPVT